MSCFVTWQIDCNKSTVYTQHALKNNLSCIHKYVYTSNHMYITMSYIHIALLMSQYFSIDGWHFIFILPIDTPLENAKADFQPIVVSFILKYFMPKMCVEARGFSN